MQTKKAMCQCETVQEVIELYTKQLKDCWHIDEEVEELQEECVNVIQDIIADLEVEAMDEGKQKAITDMENMLWKL